MGLQDPFFSRMFRLAEAAAQQVTEAQLRQAATTSSYNTGGSRSMGPTRSKLQVCVDQRDNRSSSHPLQATST